MKSAATFLLTFLVVVIGVYFGLTAMFSSSRLYRQWDMQSIDTMKYSRDMARDQLKNPDRFEKEIDDQMRDISATGATHVAIGTPYDKEFLPVMQAWVEGARRHKLNVWFRGNFSGAEGWFNYPKIDKETHTSGLKDFIVSNSDLFEDGDIFTSCTECENGYPVEYGDKAGVARHKEFLLKEYAVTKEAFATIKKDVKSNYYPMNGDLARVMMDKETTAQFDGVIVVDHYVADPVKLANDLRDLTNQSGGTVILGEFGAPIPDLHGKMTEEEQALWVDNAMREISHIPNVGGVNYWVNKDGSTAMWKMDGKAKQVVNVVTKYFKGKMHTIKIG